MYVPVHNSVLSLIYKQQIPTVLTLFIRFKNYLIRSGKYKTIANNLQSLLLGQSNDSVNSEKRLGLVTSLLVSRDETSYR